MDPVQEKLALIEQKIDAVYASAEKTRKYILSMLVITVAMILLPLLLAALILPALLNSLQGMYQI